MRNKAFGLTVVAMAALVGVCVGIGFGFLPEARAADNPTPQTVTVFVDSIIGFREDSFAKTLSKTHAEYAARGYRFVGMELYNENGDMEGMFVTYQRD